ncbi:hypothetical protein [Paenibacillus aestuarii]|uniref:Uncharacterized protein n=1 Tax=Paenibacillus aestuarii TaxID=516965 RepID=A0ABW0KFV5_9BACL|nr:hypothetical protein [Paenibacillus aestuarii]
MNKTQFDQLFNKAFKDSWTQAYECVPLPSQKLLQESTKKMMAILDRTSCLPNNRSLIENPS